MNEAASSNPGGVTVRPADPADLPQLAAISRADAFAAQWSEPLWLDIFHTQNPPRRAWLAQDAAARAIGFLVAQCGGAEWELENMAVLAEFRGRGAGSALLAALVAEARAQHAERILLEVRPSNRPAIRLYEQGGFQLLSRRPGYYGNPTEDALILVHILE